MEPIKKSTYRPSPISDEVCIELEKKYGVPAAEIKRLAKELRFGRPKLEMHLLVMAREAKTRRS